MLEHVGEVVLPQGSAAASDAFDTDPALGLAVVIMAFKLLSRQHLVNLEMFLQHSISRWSTSIDFVLVNNGNETDLPLLPTLPNLRVLHRDNMCWDFGAWGHGVKYLQDLRQFYRYYVFWNPSVKGPYLPGSWDPQRHWTELLLRRITSVTKLVGPTINCGGLTEKRMGFRCRDWQHTSVYRYGSECDQEECAVCHYPHVQTSVWATDRLGLELILRESDILNCTMGGATGSISRQERIMELVVKREIGLSNLFIRHGYNIGSLLREYEGVDFRQQRNHWCNGLADPMYPLAFHGRSVDREEALFLKVSKHAMEARVLDDAPFLHVVGLR
jgi:hypothetical protein